MLGKDRPILVNGGEDAAPFALGQLFDDSIEERRLASPVRGRLGFRLYGGRG